MVKINDLGKLLKLYKTWKIMKLIWDIISITICWPNIRASTEAKLLFQIRLKVVYQSVELLFCFDMRILRLLKRN